jgi:hypothetical protein
VANVKIGIPADFVGHRNSQREQTMRIRDNKGPVVFCPVLYSSFWGSGWTDPKNVTVKAQLTHFLDDLLHSNWMNVLHQYGVNGGIFAQESIVPIVPNPDLTIRDAQKNLQIMIDNHGLGVPVQLNGSSPPIVIVFLDASTRIIDVHQTAFGFHDSFITTNGQPLVYAFVKYQVDSTNQPDLNALTKVASHEFAEMVTDPLGNGWTNPPTEEDEGEICDSRRCQQAFGLIDRSGGGTWSVASIFSNVDDKCVSGADQPIPPIPRLIQPGFGERGLAQSRSDILPYRRLTPLPPVHFDLQTQKAHIRNADYFAYYRKIFHPLHHKHFFPDFPTFLRELASVLERAEE